MSTYEKLTKASIAAAASKALETVQVHTQKQVSLSNLWQYTRRHQHIMKIKSYILVIT